jgi:hypothetical protein
MLPALDAADSVQVSFLMATMFACVVLVGYLAHNQRVVP